MFFYPQRIKIEDTNTKQQGGTANDERNVKNYLCQEERARL
ncbi:hypothetical protein ANACOL_04446 [Anaerotruncus colihominis DSM 17241]|uniref:Uncharacterized protein n=1 Tax=Anaerotruncus colihominis DSM 17241 TaxID=445972 RepID=B0PI02_9FIRM|nr:hypothetical protein ANACOL_04446 [Anaerotruncus colihominis DSM 17241]